MTCTITPVSAGQAGVDYLLRQQGCAEGPEKDTERDSTEYYLGATERGEAAGVWIGDGVTDLGMRAGDTIVEDDVRSIFGFLQHPETGQQIGRKPSKFKSLQTRIAEALEAEPDATEERQDEIRNRVRGAQQTARAYFDVTFSPSKSVSVYYAALRSAGRFEDAEKVWGAHRKAVEQAMSYLQREAGYSRAGYHGRAANGTTIGEHVDGHRWIGVRFDHTTNRNNEPQIHSHVAVLNRVLTDDETGKWRTLDSKALYGERRMAGAVYESVLEEQMMRDHEIRFAWREDGKAREIVGLTTEDRDRFSTRRAEVKKQVEEWVAEYEERHGRAPDAYTVTLFSQKAALHTRNPKGHTSSTAVELDEEWNESFTRDREVTFAGRLEEIAQQSHGVETTILDADRRREICRLAVADIQRERASWTRSDLGGTLRRHLPDRLDLSGADLESLITSLADEATAPGQGVVTLTAPESVEVPDALLRSDGRSRFRPHRNERFATESQIATEERIAATVVTGNAPRLTEAELAVAEAELIAGKLDADQRAAVLGILGSGRFADAVIGPAGSGKSFTMGALEQQWRDKVGAPVIGLATSQVAAGVLSEDGIEAHNITRFLIDHEPDARTGLPNKTLDPKSLLVIDESGMSATSEIDRVRRIAEQWGAKLVFTGDHEQLDAVGAGGALRLLAQRIDPFELEVAEGRRFQSAWERDASLRLRDGDRAVIHDYNVRGRLVEGTSEQMSEAAMRAYLADTLDGRKSLLMVDTNDQAANLSAHIRDQLQRLGLVSTGDEVALRDGNAASIGDIIQTRKNDYTLRCESGRWTVNRDVWRVDDVLADGSLRVVLDKGNEAVTLPPEYVHEHATLAYAATVHASQGRTVDTAHSLVTQESNRQAFYVQMTRGRVGNWAYVVTSAEADHDNHAESFRSTTEAVLGEVLDRDVAQRSATEVLANSLADSESLAMLGELWTQTGREQNRDRYADLLHEQVGAEIMDRISAEHGDQRLWRAIRSAELAGHDPAEVIDRALDGRTVADAQSVSDVIRWRVQGITGVTPEPTMQSWVERTVSRGSTIDEYRLALAEAMDARQTELGHQVAEDAPEWARKHLGPVPDDPIERAQWVEKAGAVQAWREWSGRGDDPLTLGPAPSREMPDHRAAWDAAYVALGAPDEGRDFAAATDDELQVTVADFNRAQEWAPDYAADLLREASERADRFRRDAILERASAELITDERERADALARADRKETIANEQRARAEQFQTVHEARQAWMEHTEPQRVAAEMATRELDVRRDAEQARQAEARKVWDELQDDTTVGHHAEPDRDEITTREQEWATDAERAATGEPPTRPEPTGDRAQPEDDADRTQPVRRTVIDRADTAAADQAEAEVPTDHEPVGERQQALTEPADDETDTGDNSRRRPRTKEDIAAMVERADRARERIAEQKELAEIERAERAQRADEQRQPEPEPVHQAEPAVEIEREL